MRIACLDVGRGTLDILIYDDSRRIENATALIVPSPVIGTEERTLKLFSAGKNVLFTGCTMAGFNIKKMLARPEFSNRKVFALPDAARSFRDDLDLVRSIGIEIIEESDLEHVRASKDVEEVVFADIDLEKLRKALAIMGETEDFDAIGVAVQDHGSAPRGMSDRRFRFEYMQELLDGGFSFERVTYDRTSIPERFTRMQGVAKCIPEKYDLRLMDTGFAALSGAMMDNSCGTAEKKILVNIGNGHTLGMFIDHGDVPALFEHHTSVLDNKMLSSLINEFVEGRVTNDLVFEQNGHGAFLRTGYDFPKRGDVPVFVTGPNRAMLKGTGCSFPAPFGNMMLTGAYGLLRAFDIKL